jgi:RNA polymerase sigma factor (sigma-70 family)
MKDPVPKPSNLEETQQRMIRTYDDVPATRVSLLNRLKNWEDNESWQVFYDTYHRLIRRFALHCRLTDVEADDVVQETVLTVAKKIGEFEYDPKRGSFKSWLLHTTRWKIGDQFKKRAKASPEAELSDNDESRRTAILDRVPDPASEEMESIWNREYQKTVLETAIAKVKSEIDAKHFQVYDLYALKDWPVTKVAALLGMNSARVYLIKHRISLLVKKEVKRLESGRI